MLWRMKKEWLPPEYTVRLANHPKVGEEEYSLWSGKEGEEGMGSVLQNTS